MAMILISGFVFGAILHYARLNKYNVISGLAVLEDFTVAKAIASAIGIGAILINVEIMLGLASYHVKPILPGSLIAGGMVFGIGMAVLGYCPGTLFISAGEGALDAFIGIAGGLAGGLAYSLLAPYAGSIAGPNFGTVSLNTMTGTNTLFMLLTTGIGALFVFIALQLHKKDKEKNYRWLHAGAALAVLNAVLFLTSTFNRPVGASTAFPYLADLLTGATGNSYFVKIQEAGNWQVIFLAGAFLAGLIFSIVKKEFRLTMIHSNWKRFKGQSGSKRVLWAFTGGFLLINGARLAGGCTSGHILSGGMQLAVSSFIFALVAFTGFLITGKLFYRSKQN